MVLPDLKIFSSTSLEGKISYKKDDKKGQEKKRYEEEKKYAEESKYEEERERERERERDDMWL